VRAIAGPLANGRIPDRYYPVMTLVAGHVFAGYTILRPLGAGGMGEVYLTTHPRLPRHDALKILPAMLSEDAEYRARFEREADLASTLWHPHIVGVHDRGEAEGRLWISMDFVDGQDAARLVGEVYPTGMPATMVADIVTAIASALDYAHKQGLLHRDVKPANIMLTGADDDGVRRILLADFGIARAMDDISGLTATNVTMGTVDYCAPEQLMGEPIDGRTDQYSLAATAYYLLTGTTVFPHTNPTAVVGRHLTAPPPRLGESKPELSGADAVLLAALAKEPADRFSRCTDFALALAEHLTTAHPPAAGPTVPSPVVARSSTPTTANPASAATQARAAQLPRPASTPQPAIAQSSRHAPRRRLAAVGVALALLAIVVGTLWWQPWAPNIRPAANAPTSSTPNSPASPGSSTPVPPPQPVAPAVTTTPADPYRYALWGCYYANSDQPEERPSVLPFVTCADGSYRLESMTWSSWGRAGAQGTGIFSFQVCQPDCADGHRAQYAVNVAAFNPAPPRPDSGCPRDMLFYGEMIIMFVAAPPSPADDMPVDSTYLGKPAIRFSTAPDAPSGGGLGNGSCN
jgi:serine/threonine protein kinase, bacterial